MSTITETYRFDNLKDGEDFQMDLSRFETIESAQYRFIGRNKEATDYNSNVDSKTNFRPNGNVSCKDNTILDVGEEEWSEIITPADVNNDLKYVEYELVVKFERIDTGTTGDITLYATIGDHNQTESFFISAGSIGTLTRSISGTALRTSSLLGVSDLDNVYITEIYWEICTYGLDDTYSETHIANYPNAPTGYEADDYRSYFRASFSAVDGSRGQVEYTWNWTNFSPGTFTRDMNVSRSTTSQIDSIDTSFSEYDEGYFSRIEYEDRRYGTRQVKTLDPGFIYDGTTYQHSGEIDENVATGWTAINLPAEVSAFETIAPTNDGDPTTFDVEFEVTATTTLPILNSPPDGSSMVDRTPTFEFFLPEDGANTETHYHTKFVIAENFDLTGVVQEYETVNDVSNWEYYDGTSWQPYPETGVDPDTDVRINLPVNLPTSILYWSAATYLGDGEYTGFTDPFSIRIELELSEEQDFLVVVDGIEYDVFSLQVIETCNGELGEVNFEILNDDGVNDSVIEWNDSVEVAFRDIYGQQQEVNCAVRQKNINGKYLNVTAQPGDRILAERIIKEDYPRLDIGELARRIIRDYGTPLTTGNIRTNIGIEANLDTTDKKIIEIFEKLRKDYQIFYFIDNNLSTHLYRKTNIDDTGFLKISYGDNNANS